MKRKRQTIGQLREMQRLMGGIIMRPLTARERMQSRGADGRAVGPVVRRVIKPNARLSSVERLEIYNRQYWFRILDCFRDDFPGLGGVLGERKFNRLALAYLASRPSRSFSLRNLGQDLERFLVEEPDWTSPHGELALDMVRLEWAHIEAFDNEAKPPVRADDLLGLDPGEVRLKLQPHLSLLAFAYPVDDFLLGIKKGNDDALRSEASNAVTTGRGGGRGKAVRRPGREAVWVAVHRHNDSVFYKRLEVGEYQVLRALGRGRTLGESCTALFDLERRTAEEWAGLVRGWFETWTALGWFWGPR